MIFSFFTPKTRFLQPLYVKNFYFYKFFRIFGRIIDTEGGLKMPNYIFPPYPSPKSKIAPHLLNEYEKTGLYVVQYKFGGSRAVIQVILPNSVKLFDRHGNQFSTLLLTPEMKENFLSLNLCENREYWLDGEFLDKKAKIKGTGKQAVKNTIVLFDVLFAEKSLSQKNQLERLDILKNICHNPQRLEPKKRAFQVCAKNNSNIWMAQTFFNDFEYHFYNFFELDETKNDMYPEIEGLILRHKNFKLENLGTKEYKVKGNVIRCRKKFF